MERQQLLALYSAPFTYDGRCFVFDADGNMVADFEGPAKTFRPRGYGRFKSSMESGDAIHDAMEAMLVKATEDCKFHPKACVYVLNSLWKWEQKDG